MNKLERQDELHLRTEEALRRSVSDASGSQKNVRTEKLSVPRIELLLEIESLLLRKNRHEAELKNKEKEYQELMSNISDGIFYTEKGIITKSNPSLSHILGFSAKALEGKAVWSLIVKNQKQQVRDIFKGQGSAGILSSHEVKCIRNDGTVFWAKLKIRHLGEGNRSFGTLSDISQSKLSEHQMKESERQLLRSNAAKDKLFSIISHDLKTPFNTLMGYTYLLMKDYGSYDDKKRESMIRSLYDVTKQTFGLLENILVWSRSQTGGFPFAPRAISITKLLIENIRLYSTTAKAKSITLTLDKNLEEVMVFADPEMVQTVLRNLMTNAIKFTPEKGTVTLGLTDDGEEKITVYIKDNGKGIDPAYKSLLFNIDNNFSTRGTHDEKGTGLGLTVCKEFVEKNGGEIWMESTPGKGSCFYFSLFKKVEEAV